ncbi:MAG: protein kinase [Solirubrobacterales bacterium]
MAEERVPETIGRYKIRRELGRGMMGVVYEAHDPSLNRPIALKVVRLLFAITDAEKESFERRFLSEARIAARLSHPGLVVVYDIGRDPETGILYIALERLQGKTLAEMTVDGARLPWRDALEIVARAAEALDYAHGQGVVHRDIKPANVMVLPTGEPKIMDFGLAKHEAGHELTAAGQFVGTPLFMAPEQVLGHKVDGRTDLFSLGSVLYTLLTGTRAFAADSVHRIMSRVAHQDPRPATEAAPDLPRVLDDVLLRAMAKDPSDRYPTGKAFADDLDDVLTGRPPRHLKGWKRPRPAEGTLVSMRAGAVAEANLPELSLGGESPLSVSAPAAARKRRGARPLRTLALALLLAGLSMYYFSSGSRDEIGNALDAVLSLIPPPIAPQSTLLPPQATPLAPQAPGPVSPSPPLPSDGLAAEGEPAEPIATVDAARTEPIGLAVVLETPTPEPHPAEAVAASPRPTPHTSPPSTVPAAVPASPRPLSPRPASPSPSPAKEPAKPRPGVKPASLSVHMEHHLRSGSVRVWLDNKVVVEEALDARVTRKVLFLTVRKGLVEESLEVAAGRHELRVQVKWDDNVEMKRITGSFRAGTTRQLEIRISRLGGDLSLAWK